MTSGKRSRQQRATTPARTPPPVRSKGVGARPRQASPRALAIGGGVVALVVIGIVLAVVLGRGGGSSGIPAGTPTVGQVGPSSLPGAADIESLYKGIPQQGLYLGAPKAPVQMVMFIDLQCPVCQDFEVNSLPTVVRKYIRTGQVRLYIRPWAFIGSDSFKARQYMVAASFQNKAFQFAGVLYDNQQPENSGWVTDSILAGIAASVPGLNVTKVFAEHSSARVNSILKDVDTAAQSENVQGTPTILIGKTGATPKDVTAPGQAATLQQVEDAIATALA